jgi:hypothetical protein
MDTFHGTTVCAVRKGDTVALGADGQVTVGNTVMKSSAIKIRRLAEGRVLAIREQIEPVQQQPRARRGRARQRMADRQVPP